jgi:regulator of sigma E protease
MDSVVYGFEVAASFVLVLGILVFVHEFGHFIVAKSLRIGVPVFSLGLGPRLFGFHRGGTDYRVSWVPLGGYVRLAGEDPNEQTGAPEEFLSRPRWQRFLVFVAGAVFNIVLALIVTWLILVAYGKPEARHPDAYPVVALVEEGAAAEAAGLEEGDAVLAINDRDARLPEVQRDEIMFSPGKQAQVRIERDGQEMTIPLEVGADEIYGLGHAGWFLVQEGTEPPEILSVQEGWPAEEAGVQEGDRVLALGGWEPVSEVEFRSLLARNPEQELELKLDRGGEIVVVTVVPRLDEDGRGKIGVVPSAGGYVIREFGAWEAVGEAVQINIEQSAVLFVTLKKMFTGDIPVRALSGPIEIARVSRQMVTSMQSFLGLLAFISLQLGILNLLPIPVLDGGHILILGVEGTMRRSLPDRLKERVMLAGLVFLLAVFSLVIYMDLDKAFSL